MGKGSVVAGRDEGDVEDRGCVCDCVDGFAVVGGFEDLLAGISFRGFGGSSFSLGIEKACHVRGLTCWSVSFHGAPWSLGTFCTHSAVADDFFHLVKDTEDLC